LVLGAVLYLVLLPVWWAALGAIASFAATLANLVYHFFDPLVTINPDGKVVRVFASASQQSGFGNLNPHQLALRLDTVTYGMPMLAALVLATRADSTRAKVRALIIGLAVMMLLTVPAVMMWAKLTSLQLDEQIAQATFTGSATRSGFFYYAFHGYAFSQPVVAAGIWLALMVLGTFKQNIRQENPVAEKLAAATVGRNAHCPCGSGRKYKRCCGSA
jgi:hypothetical protein